MNKTKLQLMTTLIFSILVAYSFVVENNLNLTTALFFIGCFTLLSIKGDEKFVKIVKKLF